MSRSIVGNFTLLDVYLRCPKQAFHKYVARDYPWPKKTRDQNKGVDHHKVLAAWVRGAKPSQPEVLFGPAAGLCEKVISSTAELYAHSADAKLLVEKQLAIGWNFLPVEYDDPKAMFRSVLDLAIIIGTRALLYDWKTGRVWEDPAELLLHALLLQSHNQQVTEMRGTYVWLKENTIGCEYDLSSTLFTARTLRENMQEFVQREMWPARKNPLCPWCDLKTCEHWRSRA